MGVVMAEDTVSNVDSERTFSQLTLLSKSHDISLLFVSPMTSNDDT